MTGHLATAPSEREAFRRSGVRAVGVDEAAAGSDPAVVRRSFCALNEASYHLDSAAEPWTVHLEVRLSGSVVGDRLRRAVRVALGRQPRVCARLATGRWGRVEWQITPGPDVDPLDIVGCSDDDALQAARAELQSLAVPLATSPPLRVRLARHPQGDVIMLNVHHAAGDGIAAQGLLRSIARAYAGRPDPVAQTPPEELEIPAPSGRWAQLRALVEEFRQAAPRSVHLTPSGGEDRPGYRLHHLVLDPAQTAALAAKAAAGATVNDLLLAGLHLALDDWNSGHGGVAGRLSGSCRSTCGPRHAGTRCSETSPSSCPWSPAPRIELTPPPQSRPSAAASGPDLRACEVWFAPPARMPMGLAVGAVTARGRLHLVFGYRPPLFGPTDIVDFAGGYLAALGHVVACAGIGFPR